MSTLTERQQLESTQTLVRAYRWEGVHDSAKALVPELQHMLAIAGASLVEARVLGTMSERVPRLRLRITSPSRGEFRVEVAPGSTIVMTFIHGELRNVHDMPTEQYEVIFGTPVVTIRAEETPERKALL